MIVYADSCGLVKWYVSELGTPEVQAYLGQASEIGTAEITLVEVVAGIAKKVRAADISLADGQAAVSSAVSQWPVLRQVPIDSALVGHAHLLAWSHALRGYDAVQLAAALAFVQLASDPITVLTFDKNLHAGA